MSVLARNCPLTASLRLDLWIKELAYMAADAAARNHWKLSTYALYATATCISTGFEGCDRAVRDANVLPLLRNLSEHLSEHGSTAAVRRAVATVVGAVAQQGQVDEEWRGWWSEVLLSWVCGGEGGREEEVQREEVSIAASTALGGVLLLWGVCGG